MGVSFKHKGNFEKTTQFLYTASNDKRILTILNKYGRKGVDILRQATPKNTGLTSESWVYEIVRTSDGYKIAFNNTNTNKEGTPVVVLIQYGHGTRSGGYVKANDFINPALKPLFEELSLALWNEVNT